MTLNLNKHGAAMQAAWKEVVDINNPINWALFGYEGQTFDLKLVGKGEDGVEELKDDLNANKIMYAFCRIDDPKTSLPKYVLINWQGETAPGTRKGMCATHLRDVSNYFHGHHLTINARSDDEIDEEEIVKQVAKASASSFNFHQKPQGMDEAPAPVGTAHRRIIPEREVPKLSEREQYWIEEQQKEKARINAERERKISEQQKFEQDRLERERKESLRRDEITNERDRKISRIREAEAAVDAKKEDEKSMWERQQVEDQKEEEARRKRSDVMRQERNQEAKQLIGQRAGEARAVFERNTSVGQLNFRKASTEQPATQTVSPIPKSVSPIPAPKSPEPKAVSPPPKSVSPVPAPKSPVSPVTDQARTSSLTSPRPYQAAPKATSPVEPPRPESPVITAQPATIIESNGHSPVPPPAFFDDPPTTEAKDPAESKDPAEYGLCAMALYDYQAGDETEISFDPGQIITHIDQIDPGWWQGLGPDGSFGLFPANYVELIDSNEVIQYK